MNNHGQVSPGSLASHIVLWVVIAGILGWLVWSATHTTTENNKYGNGANHVEIVEHNWPLSIHPCGALFSFNDDKVKNANTKNIK